MPQIVQIFLTLQDRILLQTWKYNFGVSCLLIFPVCSTLVFNTFL